MRAKMAGAAIGVAIGLILGPVSVLLGIASSILWHYARARAMRQIKAREHLQRCLELTELMEDA